MFIRSIVIVLSLVFAMAGSAQEQSELTLTHMDELEVLLKDGRYLSYVTGNVEFETQSGKIYCDSAVWSQDEFVRLNGYVRVDDSAYSLTADSVYYDLVDSLVTAWGERVELWSFEDSIYAVGPFAVFDRREQNFYMNQRPLLYLKYPDSATMVEVLADSVAYTGDSSLAVAVGEVIISSEEFASNSGLAVMNGDDNVLILSEEPTAERGGSRLSGGLITVYYQDDLIRSIEVVDSATGDFVQPVDSAGIFTDRSVLSGGRILMDFENGLLSGITCTEQAYSWYYPSTRGGREFHENSVSGDTIRFRVDNERLLAVEVLGGAIGTYINGRKTLGDSVVVTSADTVDYNARFIEYNMVDSLITLQESGRVTSGSMALSAERILFDTKGSIVEAFSASLESDSSVEASGLAARMQPNDLPVELQDGADVMYGDYLEYSLITKKGRIIKSKSSYDKGHYYGDKMFQEQENIFYIEEGSFTTCDWEEPHFHFRSKDIKLIEGDKLIARPVVFYLGRVPLFVIPYYVFPLKRGRHSGFLPFTFGNFERGVRYVRDLGYYWAASEYWDWRNSLDYYDNRRTFTLNSKVRFAKRYVIENTYLSGSFTRETSYNKFTANEGRRDRWAVKGAYNHHLTPSLTVKAFGEMQSDKSYFTDFSPNLEERLNREIKSQATISKKFGSAASLTATLSHTVNLDKESRVDNIPNLNISLPTVYPFGNGSRDADGKLQQKWYHNFTLRYSPSLQHLSTRTTPDSTIAHDEVFLDSVFVDSTGLWEFTTDTVTVQDTISYRSRKHYIKLNHSPAVTLPRIALGSYVNIIPSFRYSETWFKIFGTDQSEAKGIDPGTYRTYSWSTGVTASSKLYGTVQPNVVGVTGLRHVLEPRVSYSYSPEVDRHPEVRAFAGGGAGSRKSSLVSFALKQDFMSRIKSGEDERSLNLLILNSSVSYNFEADDKPWSILKTTYQSTAVPNLNLHGDFTHSLYDPDTDELSFWSPFWQSFSFNASFNLKGVFPLFDDTGIPRGADSASQLSGQTAGSSGGAGRGSWNCRLDYRYSESGRGAAWSKSNSFFVQFGVAFDLTEGTRVTYTQRYDFLESKTISSSVNIIRKLHCWSGSLYWVPVGSNRGFGFKLFVTDLPEIKIDNGHDSFTTGLQRFR